MQSSHSSPTSAADGRLEIAPGPAPRWYLLAAAIAALVLWHAWFSQFNHDEIEHLHASWLVARGQIPFADFLEQHHPTLWYLLAPATGWFSSVHALVFAARLLDLGCLLALLAVFVRLLRRVYPVRARWPTLLLVSSFMFIRNMMEIRPDPLMNTLVYAGLLSWVAFLQEGRYRRALVAGLLLGAAVAVLQKALVVLALVAAASLLLAVLHRVERQRRTQLVAGTAAMLAAAVGPVAGLFAFVAARGFWRDFWFWNYQFNHFFYLRTALSKHFSVLITVGLSVAEDPVLWIAGTAGIVLCARDFLRERRCSGGRDDSRIGLLVVALGYVAFLCLNGFPFEQYFIVLLPLLALFSAELFVHLSAVRARSWLEWSVLFMATVLACILLVYPGNRSQLQVQDLVLEQTMPDQAVFIPPAYNPIFRPHSGYFWYNGSLIANTYAEYCRNHVECPGHKQELDNERWASNPPSFVYLEYPEYYPLHWSERSQGYEETSVPRLLRARKRPLWSGAGR